MAKNKKQKTTGKEVVDKQLLRFNPFCPECEDQIISDETGKIKTVYCPDCGTKLIQPSRCIWCNSPCSSVADFCTSCGFEIIR